MLSRGISLELTGIDLGDERLNQRSCEVLSVDPTASVNGSFERWSDTLAAYRLLANERVSAEAILEPHRRATLSRMSAESVVLVVQDTTELDLTKHAPRDAGCLNKPDRFGLYLHPHLAVNAAGLPLGIVGSHVFDRSPESLGRTLERRDLPIEHKESYRWLEGYRLASDIQQQCPQTGVVNVADRDADMYDIFLEVYGSPESEEPSETGSVTARRADFVIRSKENRRLNQRVPPHEHASRNVVYRKMYDEVRKAPPHHQIITLTRTPQRAAREAELEIRAEAVTLKHPKNRRGLPEVPCHVVHVREINGPENEEHIEWWLITSLPIDTVDDIERVINYYQTRWTIEVYFRVLKTGCRVEEIQLETTARVKNCLAFYQIIAWRVLHLTHQNRQTPQVPCTAVFDDCEWQPVWRVTTQQDLPDNPPTLSEFIGRLASLGGYNNRATEPPPGPQVLWIGTRRMSDFALAWKAFGPNRKTCV